jgi:DNA-binding PadR family transcriptional regulator
MQKDAEAQLPLTTLWYNILLALADEARHGYGIIKEIELRTDGRMSPGTGTVYLALQRLEEDGLIAESKETAEATERVHRDKRRRRWYELTPQGRAVLAAETRRLLAEVSLAVEKGVIDSSSLKTL